MMEHDDVIVRHYLTMTPNENDVVSKPSFSYLIVSSHIGGDYHAACESNIDCQTNLICNNTSIPRLCSCELHYRYYSSVRKCRGDPGAVCDQATAECADNAECRDGACECAYQFIPNGNKRCG
jgi:hypothetical protein